MRINILIILFIVTLILMVSINFFVLGNFNDHFVDHFGAPPTCSFYPHDNPVNCISTCLDTAGCNTIDCLERCKNRIINMGNPNPTSSSQSDTKEATDKLAPSINEIKVIRNGSIKINVSHVSSGARDDNGNPIPIPINIRSYIYTIRPDNDAGNVNNVHVGTYNLTRSDIQQIFLYNYSIKCLYDYNLHDINLNLNQHIRTYTSTPDLLVDIYNKAKTGSNEKTNEMEEEFNKWKHKLKDYGNKFTTTANTCVELKNMDIPSIDINVDKLNPDIIYNITVRSYEPEQKKCDSSLFSLNTNTDNTEGVFNGRVNKIINNIAKQYDQVYTEININDTSTSTNQLWIKDMFIFFFVNPHFVDNTVDNPFVNNHIGTENFLWKSENHRDFVCRILMDNQNLGYFSNITHADFMFGNSKLNNVNINIPFELQFECGTMYKPCIPITRNEIQEPSRSDTISETVNPNLENIKNSINGLIDYEQEMNDRINSIEEDLFNLKLHEGQEPEDLVEDLKNTKLEKQKIQEYSKSYNNTFSIPDHLSKKSNMYKIQPHLHKQNIPLMVSDTIQGLFSHYHSSAADANADMMNGTGNNQANVR